MNPSIVIASLPNLAHHKCDGPTANLKALGDSDPNPPNVLYANEITNKIILHD